MVGDFEEEVALLLEGQDGKLLEVVEDHLHEGFDILMLEAHEVADHFAGLLGILAASPEEELKRIVSAHGGVERVDLQVFANEVEDVDLGTGGEESTLWLVQ